MSISLFLAKALGLYLLVSGIGLISKRKRIKLLFASFLENKAWVHLSGMVTLVIGILLVISHNIWDTGWQSIISALAWLTLLKGIVRTLLPADKFRALVGKMNLNENKYLFFGAVSVVLGIYLTYIGFYF